MHKPHLLSGLSNFKPVLSCCHQGQKRRGVEAGAYYIYENCFKHICKSQPFAIQNVQFDTQYGYQKLYGQCRDLNLPLNIGGDHSVASSSVLASLQKFRKFHVLWVDAHPDIHTYSSTVSGNTHGTPLSVCVGLEKTHWASRLSLTQLDFSRLIYVGIRDIDDFEADIIKRHNIRVYTPQQAVEWMQSNPELPIHISFDVDALDPSYVCSTGTKVDGGLHPEEVRAMLGESLQRGQLKSLDVVEFNQELGNPEHSAKSVR